MKSFKQFCESKKPKPIAAFSDKHRFKVIVSRKYKSGNTLTKEYYFTHKDKAEKFSSFHTNKGHSATSVLSAN